MTMGSLYLLLTFARSAANGPSSEKLGCLKTGSCRETGDSNTGALLQKKAAKVVQHVHGMQRPEEDSYAFTDENGYPIHKIEKDGYSYYVNVSWSGAGAHLYHHVKNSDMCNVLCARDTECVGFVFHHQAEDDGNHRCYLATSQGQGIYYHPCCHVGVPWKFTTTTTTTTARPGTFTLHYTEKLANEEHTAWVYTDWCLTEINSEYVVERCDLAKPEMNWEKKEDGGYYVNSISRRCMGFGREKEAGSTAMMGLLVPLDPSVLEKPSEECAFLDGKKLKIGKKFFDAYTKMCYQEVMQDKLKWWWQCTISEVFEDFENEGYASKRYITAYPGTLQRSWTETEASASPSLLEQSSTSGEDFDQNPISNCRNMATKTCPTIEMVKEVPSRNRHQCWDGVQLPWWGECRCNLAGQGCGGPVPCLVKIIEIVDFACLQYETITDTSKDAAIGKSSAE